MFFLTLYFLSIRSELNILVSETTHKMESVAHPSDLFSQAKEVIFFPRKTSITYPPVQTKKLSAQSAIEGDRIQESYSEDGKIVDITELYLKVPPQTPTENNDSPSDPLKTTENL